MWPVISKGTLRFPLTKSKFQLGFEEKIISFKMISCLWKLNKYSWRYCKYKNQYLFLLFLLHFGILFYIYLNLGLADLKVPFDIMGHKYNQHKFLQPIFKVTASSAAIETAAMLDFKGSRLIQTKSKVKLKHVAI